MLIDLLQSPHFSVFLIVALGFMLGRIKIKGLSLDISAVIFIALAFGHWGVSIPKALGNFGLVLFIYTIGLQAGPGFIDSFRSKAGCRWTDSRGFVEYAGIGRRYRQYKLFLGLYSLWRGIPVWSNRRDIVCEVSS